ncbi:unnamed protein product [Citrullus colocynthis]|uniref:Uncharacterized protein n=1 Tax=Citrullus colocynthis TaxID=252529 RepID=A0ABP0YS03_9ROSI
MDMEDCRVSCHVGPRTCDRHEEPLRGVVVAEALEKPPRRPRGIKQLAIGPYLRGPASIMLLLSMSIKSCHGLDASFDASYSVEARFDTHFP